MDHKEAVYYPFMLAVKELTPAILVAITDLVARDIKPYVLVYGDAVILATTDMSEAVMQAIEVLKAKGFEVHTFGGSPTPPVCPPTGCKP